MNKTTFFSPVQDLVLEVETLMHAQADDYHPDLKAAMDLLLSSGGKRIRPTITLLSSRMLGADRQVSITLAAAIELLHTATLVHDDLIDSSLLRRGHPTLNSQWSPGATVLTGDFIFSRAAKMAADTNSVEVMKLFAQTLTIIVNGELTQLFNNHCDPNRNSYYQRIYSKTASLFETSSASAGLIGNANAETIEKLRVFGHDIGMAFQIVDDILDFTGEQTILGKPVGSDLRQGLITLPAIYFIENNPDDPGVQILLSGKCDLVPGRISHLVESIRSSEAVPLAYQEACHYIDSGLASLRTLPDHPDRKALEELAQYIVQRNI